LALFRTGIEKAEALDMKEQLVTDARRVLKEEKARLFKQKRKTYYWITRFACQPRISEIIMILSQAAQDVFACCLWYCVVIVLLLSLGKFISSSFLLIFLPGCSKEDAERCHRLA